MTHTSLLVECCTISLQNCRIAFGWRAPRGGLEIRITALRLRNWSHALMTFIGNAISLMMVLRMRLLAYGTLLILVVREVVLNGWRSLKSVPKTMRQTIC